MEGIRKGEEGETDHEARRDDSFRGKMEGGDIIFTRCHVEGRRGII